MQIAGTLLDAGLQQFVDLDISHEVLFPRSGGQPFGGDLSLTLPSDRRWQPNTPVSTGDYSRRPHNAQVGGIYVSLSVVVKWWR